tara:strand:- start:154 stop:828 length:675 start_codon:yes stop_codon:yes gene_type:complete
LVLNLKDVLGRKNCIIFDLDGTLVDSAETIILALVSAFHKLQIVPLMPIDRSLIGPALDKVVLELLPEESRHILHEISSSFREVYDHSLCIQCTLYPDIIEMLESLRNSNKLFLVTNKRSIPTKRILAHHNLDRFFEDKYSIDSFVAQGITKKDVIKYMLSENKLNITDCIYIGDTVSDMESCSAVGMDFIFATWGYGDLPSYSVGCREARGVLTTCSSATALT